MVLSSEEKRRRVEALVEALEALAESVGEDEFVEHLAESLARLPRLAGFRGELLTLARAALVRDEVTEAIAGAPRRISSRDEVMTADEVLSEARIAGEARRGVLREEMLDATAVSRVLGSRSENLRQYANALRHRGDVVGIPHRNRYLYPAFKIDVHMRRVDPVVKAVNRTLGANEDPWGVASWWLSPNDRLAGRRPRDVLEDAVERERLPVIAEALIEATG
jgi:hypothetical protein